MMPLRAICLLLPIIFHLALPTGPCLEVDRIGVLATGEVLPQECPLGGWLKDEPGFQLTFIPTKADFVMLLTTEASRRLVRQYFPRTREELISAYHFIAYVDADLTPYTSRQMEDMEYAIGEAGLSGFASLGGSVFTWNYGIWASSPLADVFPHNFLLHASGQLSPPFTIEVNQRTELAPVLKMLVPVGIESVVGLSWGRVYPKEASTIWAWLKPIGEQERSPFLVSMPYGSKGGTTWCTADDLDHPWWSSVYQPTTNEYAQDVFLNIIHYSLGHDMPEDILAIHDVRIRLVNFRAWRASALGMMDFLEEFGAPMNGLMAELVSLDEVSEQAKSYYARQEYREASAVMESLARLSRQLDEKAMRIKNRTMFWIYATEWIAVTSTFLVALTLIQILMVRRRLSRVVHTTKFGQS